MLNLLVHICTSYPFFRKIRTNGAKVTDNILQIKIFEEQNYIFPTKVWYLLDFRHHSVRKFRKES